MAQAFDASAQQALLIQRAESALAMAKRMGADAAEVGASVDQGIGVSVREGEVETVELSRDQGIAITVYVGQRKGSASSTDASEASLQATVEKALAIARYTGEDPAAGLADAALMATDLPDLKVHHPWALTTDQAIELALSCEQAGREVAGITQSDGASLSSGEGVRVYANSHGFIGTQKGSRHSLSCMLIAEDAQGMQRDMDYTSARDPGQLTDPATVGREAARRTLRRLGAKRPPTGTYPVLFDPSLASGLVGHLMGPLRAVHYIARRLSCVIDSTHRYFPIGSASRSGQWRSARQPALPLMAKACKPVITALSTVARSRATCCRPTALGA